ncbi:MAG TPA: tRNA uridine-5-carboxymethylaminomethyl(34) synthesis enzyme MnmG [Spirochaetia bacterium]|nr:tRNA uridine-5-carboxymethylaminomethyl(34) synthesis enzyme MnmG [Spirochaetia bacterium]
MAADFDAIVVGGGHAGIEAALACARLGFSTALVTQSMETIGRMSCNPAIGGIAKGNLVREIDALGGQMARLIDASMIQFRLLNASRGPAVQAPRAQADKALYAALARRALEAQAGLALLQDTVVDLVVEADGRTGGVLTVRGRQVRARAVVLTTGTFMEGRLFIGEWSAPGGRLGEPAAEGLGTALRRRGFTVGRMKTGTPARGRARSLDTGRMELQLADPVALPFSFSTARVDRPSVPCWITYTNERTHAVIRENMSRSPLYTGRILGRGPRYCPSIEDKVVRFPDRIRHQVFVEPEGLDTDEVYLNGVSSSLPEDVQERFLRTIAGLEKLEIARPGYAVEYDYLDPTQLLPSLMTKAIPGLFVAGQTNGTSGYEEAAGQGILAGINAGLYLQGRPPLVLSRAEAYLGVMVDDLVTRGTEEPYRLFTSRAEYRLSLRHDTADVRLLMKARSVGLQDAEAEQRLREKIEGLDEIRQLVRLRRVSRDDAARAPTLAAHLGATFEVALRDPTVAAAALAGVEPGFARFAAQWLSLVESEVKYEGYIRRQDELVGRFRSLEDRRIPEEFDWDTASGLSSEAREKLRRIRPASVGQASRVPGVRPPDIAVLLLHLGKGRGR